MIWLNLTLVIVMVIGFIWSVFGWKRRSVLHLFFGGLFILTPIFYFLGWMTVLPLVPGIALFIAYFATGKLKRA
ncbi:hypothetical protein [Piscibacillus halophilus]|uniref:hypothetical protein n=1 Tax=Piscibacillus halophilus TaxID=571933 RepID=UPI0015896DC1|nr:hypothetical protein [Piscibacillus halophilus]